MPQRFKRHLAFFDLNNDGKITIFETLQAWLRLGLNFPFSVLCTFGLQLLYSNGGFLNRYIEVKYVRNERTQLEQFPGYSDFLYSQRSSPRTQATGLCQLDTHHPILEFGLRISMDACLLVT